MKTDSDHNFSQLADARSALEALRKGEVDAVVGQGSVLLLRLRDAEEKLRRSEARYRAVVEEMYELVCRFTPDLRLTFANDGFRRFFRLPDEAIGREMPSRVLGEDSEALKRHIFGLSMEKPVDGIESRNLVEGETKWIHWTARAIFDQNEDTVEYQCVGRDITDRKRTEQMLAESESRFRAMADGLPLIVWVHDAEGRQKFVNKTFCEFFGVREKDAIEDNWQALLHPEDGPAYAEEFFVCVRDRRPFNAQVRVKRADGRWRYIESWGRPRFSSEGEYLGFVGTSADIHDRKLAEEALKKLNDTLEQRVAERTALAESRAAQLQMLALELSNAEDREREKIALVLHDDLQQYLAAIGFHLQMLLPEEIDDKNTGEKIRRVGQIVDESIQKCRSLSHDLSPPVLRQFGFLAALEWLAEDMKAKHGFNAALQFDEEAEPESAAIASVLFRCVRELLFNSVKHSGGDTAAVEARHEGGRIIVRVEDDGKGCDPGKSEEGAESGNGFGLFSIKERIAFLDGRCEIESAPGEGFRVILEVPKHGKTKREILEEKAPEAVGGPVEDFGQSRGPNVRSRSGKRRIVIADDHSVVRQGLALVLENEDDFEVVGQAADGLEAVRLAKELNPDVILMDVSMPEMSGTKATAKIRKCRPHIRIVGLSMHDDPATEQKMMKAGATAYLYKASPADKLLETIRNSLS